MEMGLRNLLQQLGKNESPYYDAKPFIIPRDEEGNIIEFEQPDPKPFYPGDFEDIEPEDLIQPLGSEEIKERFIINSMPTTKEGFEMFTNKFMRLNEEGKMMYEMLIEKNPDAGAEKILDAIMKRSEFLSNEETTGDILEERTQSKANGGIMALKRGGRGGKKSSKFKKQAKKRYDERRANVREQARSNQGSQQDNTKKTIKTGLEALIDRKDELKNISANDGSGRNQYQVEMNEFKSTPGGKKIFKKRFPNPLVKAAQGIGNYIKQGGALGILANSLGGGKKVATGFGKDASNMAKDLAGMFGLDGLMGKLVNIAGGKDTNDFNKVIENNQTSTRMRNNLAYGDPLGLNNEPFYKDEILRNLQNQVRQNTLDPYGVPNPAFGTDQFDPAAYNDMLIEDQLQKENEVRRNAFGDDKEAIEQSLTPGEINLSAINDLINLRTNDEDIFEDVSETDYTGVDPNSFPEGGVPGKVVTQAGQPLVFADGTPVTEQFDTGLNTPSGQAAVDILNSNAVSAASPYNFDNSLLYQDLISGPNPQADLMTQNRNLSYNDINDLAGGLSGGAYGGTPDFGYFADGGSINKADGGYMSGFPNKNPAESLTASDNIDDRIMQNLQFERMAPGMMGYNQGGQVMSTYDKLKAIADNNYG